MTDLASAQNLPPSPSPAPLLKLDGIKGTSVADVRPVRADGVEENRAWLPQVIIDWFMNIFKPARLKLLEEQTASRHTVGEIIQASEITQKLVDLKAIKNHPFTTVNIPLDPKMLKLHQKKAVELFKSHEFTALYGRLGKVQGVDKNEKMHHILVHHLGPEQTAFWLHLAKESGNTKVAKVAEAVGDAQFSLWEATGCTHKQCAVRYLKTDPKVVKGLLKEPGLMVRSIVIDFHEYIGRTTLNLVVAPVKTHSHHHGHGHGHHGHGHRGHAHR
uniref:Uncharacterized protein n=1 Tax=Peronospora matthiolae TaxID=2874970 RepID=A0AAV1TXK3_9STRA